MRARMSLTRQAVILGPIFTGWGYLLALTPAHQALLDTGIGPFGAMICLSRINPVSGRSNFSFLVGNALNLFAQGPLERRLLDRRFVVRDLFRGATTSFAMSDLALPCYRSHRWQRRCVCGDDVRTSACSAPTRLLPMRPQSMAASQRLTSSAIRLPNIVSVANAVLRNQLVTGPREAKGPRGHPRCLQELGSLHWRPIGFGATGQA